jgi:hypothetical protein
MSWSQHLLPSPRSPGSIILSTKKEIPRQCLNQEVFYSQRETAVIQTVTWRTIQFTGPFVFLQTELGFAFKIKLLWWEKAQQWRMDSSRGESDTTPICAVHCQVTMGSGSSWCFLRKWKCASWPAHNVLLACDKGILGSDASNLLQP